MKAAEIGGVASHLSAAALHGWEAAFPATCPWVTVPRNATVADRSAAYVFWADLGGEPGPVTSALRTVLDCARRLDFGPALAVADSALRHGAITGEELMAAAGQVRGKGAAKARRVARHASALAANPFESVLRAIALEAGLEAMPQVAIRLDGVTVHPDVVVVRRRLVLEADSWEFHTGRDAHARDCRCYTMLTVNGWTVLRFTWRQVMHDPEFVRRCLLAVATGPRAGANAA